MIHLHTRKELFNFFANNSHVLCKTNVSLSTLAVKRSVKTHSKFEFLLQKHGFSPETVVEVASALPRLRNLQKLDSVLSYLKDNDFSSTQLEKLVKDRSPFLAFDLERYIMPKIKIFQDLGYSASELAELISKKPWMLRPSVQSLNLSLSILKGLLQSDADVCKLLKVSGWYITIDLAKTLVPNIELLESCGIPLQQMTKFLYQFPRFLLSEHEVIRRSVQKAEEMGMSRSSKMFLHAVRVASSFSNSRWEIKLQAFRDVGFTEDDILRAFRQAPIVFSISADKMMNVKEALLASGKHDISCIIRNPTSLCCSIGKYHERMHVLEILDSKNLLRRWPSFGTLSRTSQQKFFEKYVAPYFEEVGGAYDLKIPVNNVNKGDGKLALDQ